jgi:DNA-binding response OmpR family regulator
VNVFSNGADMVKAVGRDTIDLFVLDWRMPRMSCIEVLKHIRNVVFKVSNLSIFEIFTFKESNHFLSAKFNA